MSTQTYQWERYWYPRDINPPISPEGFLYISSMASSEARTLFQFEEIDRIPASFYLANQALGKAKQCLEHIMQLIIQQRFALPL